VNLQKEPHFVAPAHAPTAGENAQVLDRMAALEMQSAWLVLFPIAVEPSQSIPKIVVGLSSQLFDAQGGLLGGEEHGLREHCRHDGGASLGCLS